MFMPVSSYKIVDNPSIPVGEKLLGTTNICKVILEINAAAIEKITFKASVLILFFDAFILLLSFF